MISIFKKAKNDKLKKAIKVQNVNAESDILKKVESFRMTPCGFDYSNMIKRNSKRRS